jgi:hypothetical protein
VPAGAVLKRMSCRAADGESHGNAEEYVHQRTSSDGRFRRTVSDGGDAKKSDARWSISAKARAKVTQKLEGLQRQSEAHRFIPGTICHILKRHNWKNVQESEDSHSMAHHLPAFR